MTITIHYNKSKEYFWAKSGRGSSKQEGTDPYILKENGFKSAWPDNAYAQRLGVPEWTWYTTDYKIALRMQNFADKEALEAMKEFEKELETAELEISYMECGDPTLSYFYASKFSKIHAKTLRSVWYDKDDICRKGNYGFMYSESEAEQKKLPKYMKDMTEKYGVPPNTWWTPNIFVANLLEQYATGLAAEILHAYNETIQQSKAGNADISVPVPPGIKPKDYQRAGIKWALERSGSLIADEQGLGKTFQAIGVTNVDVTIQDVLVICPSAVKINWQREFKKFTTRKCQTVIVDKVADIPKRIPNCMRVMIINFDKFSSAKERALLTKAFMNMRVDMIVIDEAHNLKNPAAKRTKAILGYQELKEPFTFHDGIATVAKKRIYLTGTPIKNRPVELWSLVSTLDPNTFNNYIRYVYTYCCATKVSIGYGKQALDVKGSSKLPQLESLLRSTIMIRRLKSDVLSELPAKTRQLVFLEPDAKTKKMLEEEKKRLSSSGNKLVKLLEKAEVTNNDAEFIAAANSMEEEKVDFEEIAGIRHDIGLAKVKAAVEHCKNIIDSMSNGVDKIIVFAHHHDVVEALEYGFTHETVKGKGEVYTDKYKPVVYTGKMNSKQKQIVIDTFQDKESPVKVFIGTSAAYTGITLTEANVVVFVELQFVPSEMLQGEDRAHRIGQRKNVLVQHLVYADSIDAKISRMFVEKMEVITSALDLYSKLGVPAKDIPKGGVDPEDIVKKVEVAGIQATSTYEQEEASVITSGKDYEEKDKKPKAKTVATKTYTNEQKQIAHSALNYLAAICDGAQEKDGMGFNKPNSYPGKALASQPYLKDNDMDVALPILNTHRRQLDNHTRDVLGLWPKGEKPLFTTKQKKVLLSASKWLADNTTDLEPVDLQILTEECSKIEDETDMSDKLADVFKGILNTYWKQLDDKYQALMVSMKLKKDRGRPKKIPASDDKPAEVKPIGKTVKKRDTEPPEYVPIKTKSLKDIYWGEVVYEDNDIKQPSGKINPKLTYKVWEYTFKPPVAIKEFENSSRVNEIREIKRIGIAYERKDGTVVSPSKFAYVSYGGVPGVKTLIFIPGIGLITKNYSSDTRVAEMFVAQLQKEKAATKPAEKQVTKIGKYSDSQREVARNSIKFLDEYFDALKEEGMSTPFTAKWIANVKRMNKTFLQYPSDNQVQDIISVLKSHKPIFKPMGVFEKLGVKLRTLKKAK